MRHLQVIKIDTDVGGLVAYVNEQVSAFGNGKVGELMNGELPARACLLKAAGGVFELLVKQNPVYISPWPFGAAALPRQEMRQCRRQLLAGLQLRRGRTAVGGGNVSYSR